MMGFLLKPPVGQKYRAFYGPNDMVLYEKGGYEEWKPPPNLDDDPFYERLKAKH